MKKYIQILLITVYIIGSTIATKSFGQCNAVATPVSQTVCSGIPITSIVLTSSAAGTIYFWTRDNTTNVTGIAAAGSGNISGTLTNNTLVPRIVTFTITPMSNNCQGTPIIATVLVNNLNAPVCNVVSCTIMLSSAAGTNAQTVCNSTAITNITYATTGATAASFIGLPPGVAGSFASNVVTISGTPTATGSFNYTVILTGSCAGTTATGLITVSPASNTITCPADITVNSTPGQCGANVNFSATTTGTPAPAITYSPTSGSFFPFGTSTVTATATNSCGTSSCQFTVTVIENEAPVINCPGNISVNTEPGQCGANVNFAATATDNCSATISYSHAPGSFFPVGTTTVTATAIDPSANSTSCSFTITVTDDELPVISVSPLLICSAGNNFGCSVNLGATANDNCAIATFTSDAPVCFPLGTTTVTWTATDIHGNVSTATQVVTRNPEINIDICASPTRTIYTGVGPQSVNLSSTVSGGTPGYTYSWSPSTGLNDATIANPIASPTGTTTYTLTVTDALGCQRGLDITINVLPMSDAVCSGNGNNVMFSVCHIPPGNPSNPQNICISANALDAHLISGSTGHNNCYLGPCGQELCFSTTTSHTSFARNVQTETIEEAKNREKPAVEVAGAFKVNVYPNPAATSFNIQLVSKSNEPITVKIMDMNGVVREVRPKLSKSNSITIGNNLTGGTYMVEVIQGTNRKLVKLVKLN